MSAFVGKWKLVDSQNFDKVMEVLGVNFVTRKLGSTSKPTVTISVDGNKMTIHTHTTFKTTEITFQFGQEFDETTADGREVKSTVTKDSDTKITQIQKHPNCDTTIVREVDGNTMTATITVNDVTSVRKYERQ